MNDLTVTDLLLLRAAEAGELLVRESRGYDEDHRPEGWEVTVYRDLVCTVDDEGRIGSLQRQGLLTDPEAGLVEVTAAGRAAIR